MIELIIHRRQIAARSKLLQDVKTTVEGPEISVSDGFREGKPTHTVDLHVRIRKPNAQESQDSQRFLTDAKRLHAWLIWNLPTKTYLLLKSLMETDIDESSKPPNFR